MIKNGTWECDSLNMWRVNSSCGVFLASIKHLNALNSFQTGLPGLFFTVSLLPAANTVSTSHLFYIAKTIKCATMDRHATDVTCP